MRSGPHSRNGRRRRGGPAPRGRTHPGLLPLALLALLLLLAWVAQRRGALARLSRPAVAQRATQAPWIDPASLVGEGWGATTDPRWGDELRHALSKLRPFRVDDEIALQALRGTLADLSFVAAVEELGVSSAGIEIDLRLREPVACVPVRRGFQLVDAEGVLISGLWPSPTRWKGTPLPVLGPIADAEGLFRDARAGDWLEETDHLDALDVALSLREHLSPDERRALGRVVIDATRARQASVSEPGIVLKLEGRRLILFGRAPSTVEPGELPSPRKWRSVARALRVEREAPWDLVDVRWDEPDISLRHPRLARAEPRPPAPARGAAPVRLDARPGVR